MSYRKVLISVDNSDFSMKIAEQGVELSSQLGADISIVLVVDTAKVNKDPESIMLPQDQINKLKKEANERIDRIIKEFPDFTFERFIPEGKPSKEIVGIANTWNADLIVMGTKGKSGLKRLLMGSTAENTLRLSNVPIFIVPSKTEIT